MLYSDDLHAGNTAVDKLCKSACCSLQRLCRDLSMAKLCIQYLDLSACHHKAMREWASQDYSEVMLTDNLEYMGLILTWKL